MSDTKYADAVARIRALENGLFSSAQIEQLLSVKSYEGALRFLTEHGWGDADTPLSAEAILTREKAKSWETVRDLLKGDDAILAVLSYGDLYHNLKAAIKDAAAPGSHGNVYFDDCEVDGAQALKESPSAFERWCDNQLIETIKPQKYNPFTAGPLVAYVLAKENEIKTVRIILTARLNGLEEEQIRERIREMYV